MSRLLINSLLGLSLFFLLLPILKGQSGNCDLSTPFYQVDLSGDEAEVYISPSISRSGLCCGITGNVTTPSCIEFEVNLAPKSQGFILDIEAGLISGINEYLIDCSNNMLIGDSFCSTESGPFTITYCKPGSFPNTFSITSIPSEVQVDDITALFDCTRPISVSNLIESTITWNDITSGTFAYNAFLDCTAGCLTTNISPDASAPNSIQYEVCGELENVHCPLSTEIICDTATIFFEHDIEDAEIEITAEQLSYCAGENILIEANTLNGGNQPKYAWFLNGSKLNLSTSSIELNYLEEGDTIIAELKSSLDCISEPIVASNILTFEIKQVAIPSITISSTQLSYCAGATVSIEAVIANGGDQPEFVWLLNGEELNFSSSSFSLNYLEQGDIITAHLASALECVSEPLVSSNSLTFEITPILSPTIEIIPPTEMNCMDSTLSFSVDLENEGDNPVISWWIDGVEVASGSEGSLDYIFNEIGVKSIEARLNSSEQCIDNSEVISMMELDIQDCLTISSSSQINASAYNLFPNPSTGLVKIDGDFSKFNAPEISIIGLSGMEIIDNSNFEISENQIQLHLFDLNSGLYFVKIMDDSKVIFSPVILVK